MAEEIKFEKALERLGKIVEELESGDVSLEDALKKYEEGVKLSRACQEHLAKAEKKIETLTKTLEGQFVKEPFECEDEAKPAAKSRVKKETLTPAPDTDEDLLL
jgi:exodeoxyribonuclease VII small subunit